MTRVVALRASTFLVVTMALFGAVSSGSPVPIAGALCLVGGCLCALALLGAAAPEPEPIPVRVRRTRRF